MNPSNQEELFNHNKNNPLIPIVHSSHAQETHNNHQPSNLISHHHDNLQ